MWEHIKPRKVTPKEDRKGMFLLGLVGLYESFVMIVTLGCYTTHIRVWLLFDYLTDDD